MRGSPDFNAEYSALAGLLSSMHTAGLLNGRYGLAPPGIFARFEGDKKTFAEQVLTDEIARQDQLKTEIDISEDSVWIAYKQLQFFDLLSLYFHSKAEGSRGDSVVPDVPTIQDGDVSVQVKEQDGAFYTLDPYPFATDSLTLSFEGRWMTPVKDLEKGPDVFESLPISKQTVTLQRA